MVRASWSINISIRVPLLDDHRFAVEPSCGASLSVGYTPALLSNIFPDLNEDSNVVIIVCGGSNINMDMLTEYREKFGKEGQQSCIAVRSGDQILLKMTTDSIPAQKAIISNKHSPGLATNGTSHAAK